MKILAVDQNAVLAADRTLWRELEKIDGCEVIVVAPEQWIESGLKLSFEPENTSLKVVPASTLFTGKSHRAIYPRLAAILKKYNPDVLFVNAEPESFLAWQTSRLKPRFPRMKLVFMSWRNIDYPSGVFPYKFSFLNTKAERAMLLRADACIAHNQMAKQIFGRKGFKNVTIISPSVVTTVFTPRLSAPDYRLPTAFIIGYVGRLVQEKGVDLLLRAAAELAQDCRILIVGDGPARQELKRLANQLGIDGRIEWVGAVRHCEVAKYLDRMDVLVLPSRTSKYWKEQFGRILIEAMACGVPVIGSDSGEIPAVIGNTGLIFKEGSVEGLKLGLVRLLSDEGMRTQLISKGMQRVSSEFDTRVIARRYWTVFSSL